MRVRRTSLTFDDRPSCARASRPLRLRRERRGGLVLCGRHLAAAARSQGLRILVPNSPGSGYDTTARAAAKAMQDAKLTDTVEVFNAAGAGGTVGLQRLVEREGRRGPPHADGARRRRRRSTPTSRRPPSTTPCRSPSSSRSPRRSSSPRTRRTPALDELVAAWKADPGKLPVGGASNAGGPDHLTPMLLAKAVGVDPEGRQLRRLRRRRRAAHRRPRQQGRLRRHRHRRGRRAGQERRRAGSSP